MSHIRRRGGPVERRRGYRTRARPRRVGQLLDPTIPPCGAAAVPPPGVLSADVLSERAPHHGPPSCKPLAGLAPVKVEVITALPERHPVEVDEGEQVASLLSTDRPMAESIPGDTTTTRLCAAQQEMTRSHPNCRDTRRCAPRRASRPRARVSANRPPGQPSSRPRPVDATRPSRLAQGQWSAQ